MNRKQRRAAEKTTPSANRQDHIAAEAFRQEQLGNLEQAGRLYKRLLTLCPSDAQACNNFGRVLLAQGKANEASAWFARALTLMPQWFDQFRGVCETLVRILPALGPAILRTNTAWPMRLTMEQLFGSDGSSTIAVDPLLLCVLTSIPARDIGLERLLTSLRLSLLDSAINASKEVVESDVTLCCALARQSFINEYVFATTPDEDASLHRIKAKLANAIDSGVTISPLWPAAIAMYEPLHTLSFAAALLKLAPGQTWPSALHEVFTQQLHEPWEERALRNSIPRLTSIDDEVSIRVRQQYEESPYPRWVRTTSGVQSSSIDMHMRGLFPNVDFSPLGKKKDVEVLIPGCGTGRHAIWVAERFQGARILALDLSLNSVCYAKRKTPAPYLDRIEYAQGDILKLGSIGRSFDMIDASGVLHHMANPIEGWRILLKLLRPGGFMHLGLYSEIGRRDVVRARNFIAERELEPTPGNIRQARQNLLETSLISVTRFHDFFTTSECRDLLFHVQESRMTIPAIKTFLAEQGLRFIGFIFDRMVMQKYQALFADAGWSLTDLDIWHEEEIKHPDTFSAMYRFWIQKP